MMTEVQQEINNFLDEKRDGAEEEVAEVSTLPLNAAEIDEVQVEKLTNGNNNNNNDDENVSVASTLPFVVRTPRANSKLILQNMEEVLKSVKKKHRAKHKRKRELKKLAQMQAAAEAAAAAAAVEDVDDIATTTTRRTIKIMGKKYDIKMKKPLQVVDLENNTEEDVSTSLLQQLSVATEKCTKIKQAVGQAITIIRDELLKNQYYNDVELQEQENDEDEEEEGDDDDDDGDDDDDDMVDESMARDNVHNLSKPPAANAFEVMMNARIKMITPDKEEASPIFGSGTDREETDSLVHVKRKLLLQSMVERKGGGKRKLDNDVLSFGDHIKQRAKRLRQILKKNTSKTEELGTSDTINKKKTRTRRKKQEKNASELNATTDENDHNEDDDNEIFSNEHEVIEDSDDMNNSKSKTKKKREKLQEFFTNKNKAVIVTPPPTTSTPVMNSSKSKIKTGRSKKEIEIEKETPVIPKTPTVVMVDEDSLDEIIKANSNERPKRTCAVRKRYDLIVEGGRPTRRSARKSKTVEVEVTDESREDEDEIEIVEFDDSSNLADINATLNCTTNISTRSMQKSTPKILAPLFRRSTPKPTTDPTIAIARRAFLHSGVPEIVRLEQTRQKQYQQNYEEIFQLFPNISHVLQYDKTDKHILKYEHNVKKSYKLKNELNKTIAPLKPQQKLGILSTCLYDDFKQLTKTPHTTTHQFNLPLTNIPAKRLVAKAWKLQHDRFPTFKCYNQLREKYRFFSAIDAGHDTQQVSESLMVTRVTKHQTNMTNNNNNINNNNNDSNIDLENSQPPAAAPNGELMFTEKYKPLLYDQVLVNLIPVMQLREFLNNWCLKNQHTNATNSDFDSESDSNSTANSAAGTVQFGNTVVLLGPRASGKTNAVFTLANELNFNVLEINAGMKRTGKRLLQELHEATQSHQIKSKDGNSSITQKKRRHENLNANGTPTLSTVVEQRKCLILIEDADIAFEQTDAGYVDAIYTLASVSKRPVIIVASDPNSAHLQRLMQQHTITFTLPHTLSITRYMAVLSLIENCPIRIDDLVSLYIYNDMDLRRTLLQLQLFVQSGGDTQKQRQLSIKGQQSNIATMEEPTTAEEAVSNLYIHKHLFDFYTLDQNNTFRIPYPIDFKLLYSNLQRLLKTYTNISTQPLSAVRRKSSCSPKKAWLNTSLEASQAKKHTATKTRDNAISNLFEHLSVAAMLDANDKCHNLMNEEFSYLAPRTLATDLTHTLVERAIEVNFSQSSSSVYKLIDKSQSSKNTLSDYLSLSALRSTRACALDWEPAMRTICRYEQQRSTEGRRSMRFYHYLRSSCSNSLSNFSTDHFNSVCCILEEDTTTATISPAAEDENQTT